jgi:3'-phosphoadenosine 5'-phosphosulfate sulfotransferase (PAPS reductase)/FAD synthetase
MEYILNCSLGKDSVAALIMLIKKDLPLDRVVFADVTPEAEFEETYIFKDEVEKKLGIKIESIRAEKWSSWDDYFYSPLSKGKNMGKCRGFPPVVGPGCAYKREFKHKPLNKSNGTGNHIYVGIALDEAHRADAKMYKNAKNEFSFPLIDLNLTEQECRDICEKYGLLHPLYRYFKRLGCWQCPKQSLASLRSLYKYWPKKWAKLEEYQKACVWDFKPDCRVEDLTKRFINEGLERKED